VVCQAVIHDVAAELRVLADQKGLQLVVSAPTEPVVAMADQRALSQILLNLVNNAIKFTDTGEVKVLVAKHEGGIVKHNHGRLIAAPYARILIEVSDTGIGIKAEDQQRLFQLFGRVESESVRKREGTGLGLRISQQLAERMGGQITVRSTPGKGSTFTLTLMIG
jgi:protein-histidine pros-kinase